MEPVFPLEFFDLASSSPERRRPPEIIARDDVHAGAPELRITNLRDPLALIRCLLTGLSQATGNTILTFTQPL